MYPKARAWIELNMANLASNLGQIRRILPRDCGVMPAVKANAYGHGAVLVGRALQELGVRDFCVAAIGEAVELREAGIQGEILILGYTSPQDFPLLTEYGLTQTVLSLPYAKLLQAYGQSRQDGRQLAGEGLQTAIISEPRAAASRPCGHRYRHAPHRRALREF